VDLCNRRKEHIIQSRLASAAACRVVQTLKHGWTFICKVNILTLFRLGSGLQFVRRSTSRLDSLTCSTNLLFLSVCVFVLNSSCLFCSRRRHLKIPGTLRFSDRTSATRTVFSNHHFYRLHEEYEYWIIFLLQCVLNVNRNENTVRELGSHDKIIQWRVVNIKWMRNSQNCFIFIRNSSSFKNNYIKTFIQL
jgi:hypothetical protein